MFNRRLAALACAPLIVAASLVASPFGAAPARAATDCDLSTKLVPSCGALWGSYVAKGSESWSVGFTDLEGKLGRRFDVVKRYHDWSNEGGNGQFPDTHEQQLGKSGDRILSFAWTSNVYSTGKHNTQWSAIAAGNYDKSVVVPEARRLKAWAKPVYLTFDHEMDGAGRKQNGAPAQYAAAYRHIHDVFKNQGVTNVAWVWNPTGFMGNVDRIAKSYPGDAYVNWIAWDPYNFYECHGSAWKTPLQTFRPFYDWLVSNGYGDKPFMLGEYGSAPNSAEAGAQGRWYSNVPGALARLPKIKAAVQFDSADPGPNCRFQVTTNSQTLAGYKSAGLEAYVRHEFPNI